MKVTVRVSRNYSVWEDLEVEVDAEEESTQEEIYALASAKAELSMEVWYEGEKTFLDEEYEILEEDEGTWPDPFNDASDYF